MPDWNAVKADFLATGMAYPALAKKWDVPLSSLKKRAARENWTGRHARVIEQSEPAVPVPPEPEGTGETAELVSMEEVAVELRRDRLQRMLKTTDAMMDRIIDALDLIKPDDTYALATLVRALKDIREMQGLNRSALDVEEQQARITKLKSEAAVQDEAHEIKVNIMGMTPEELSEVIG